MERSPPHQNTKLANTICTITKFSNFNYFKMKIQQLNYRSIGFVILLLAALLAAQPQKACAQKPQTESKLSKYELSIDLVPMIDQGQFGKVYFKINHYKEDQLKGAYRIGISRGTYFQDNEDESTWPENVTVNPDRRYHFETGLSVGYEKYKRFGPVFTYFGLDILGRYSIGRTVPETDPLDQKIVSLGLCPFWGVKHYILKNRLSTSFEIGWENSFAKNTNQYDGIAFTVTHSDIRLPYSFTINYHF